MSKALIETLAIIAVVYGIAYLNDGDPTHFMIGFTLYRATRGSRYVEQQSRGVR